MGQDTNSRGNGELGRLGRTKGCVRTDESADTERTPMITPSEVIQHIFCARFTWFMNVQHIPQNESKRYKVMKGREVHRRREVENRRYLRRKIGAVRRESSVYLASRRLRVRGIVDEVLYLKDGTVAPLDYKYTEATEVPYRTHRIQVVLYGMLIAEAYGAEVPRGFVAYIRGGSRLHEIPIRDCDRIEASGIVDEIFDIIATGRLPQRASSPVRCQDCCYRNICV